MTVNSGISKSVVDTPGEPLDLSAENYKERPESVSDPSPPNSKLTLNGGPEAEDTENPVRRPTPLEILLSQLQSHLYEIKHAKSGVRVDLFQRSDGLAVWLPGVRLCEKHNLMHGAAGCPLPHLEGA